MSRPGPRLWSVGALARAAGVTVRTLHHYDRTGLVPCSGRTGSGHRRYTGDDVTRLYRVLALRGLGLPLPEIEAVLATDDPTSLLATARLHRERVREQLAHARRLHGRLDEVIDQLEHDRAPSTDDLLDTLETMAMTVHLTRIYTRTGDDGRTHLADLSRVPKTDPRVEAGGAVDELTAAVGVALAVPDLPDGYAGWLRQIQNDLFGIGADLSRPDGGPTPDEGPRVDGSYVTWLEEICDRVSADLPALRSFVLPGGTPLAAQLHVCRTVCRRAERRVLAVPDVNPQLTRYLNRLSDLLFILARAADGGPEALWQPGRRPVTP